MPEPISFSSTDLSSREELTQIADAIDAPIVANMSESGKTPILSAAELEVMGFKIALFPSSTFRLCLRNISDFLADLQATGDSRPWMNRMATLSQANAALGLDVIRDFENQLLANGSDMTNSTEHPAPPGGLSDADRLVEGAIDFHHHGYPEIAYEQKTRHEDFDELAISRAAGMAGIVLKSHMFPTVGRAYLLRRMVPNIEIYSSITLNPSVGGFNPLALESAARQGARVVFFPTWGAAHDRERGGMSRYISHILSRAKELTKETGLRVVNPNGKVLTEVGECLAVAAEHRMTVCTGHISPRESISLAERAKDFGIESVVFSHPDSNSVAASREEIRDMVSLGAICEFCTLGMLPRFQRISPQKAIDIISEITPRNAIITTDYFFDWSPPAAETLRMVAGTFLEMGVPFEDVRRMLRDNPRRLLEQSDAVHQSQGNG